MKESPIIFSGEMVQAILEGRKTMTRRVVNLGKFRGADVDKCVPSIDGLFVPSDGIVFSTPSTRFSKAMQDKIVRCPFGVPGDRLWVRETWQTNPDKTKVIYKADYTDGGFVTDNDIYYGWKPSIFMPRWASRITLEITNVRVERLQEITSEDCIREGIQDHEDSVFDRLDKFGELWESIYGNDSWSKNSWVWVIEFRVMP
jgi:hypothetical protein